MHNVLLNFFLSILFHIGVYGDVQRVKILYNKKDSALIQMAEPHQAYLGKWIEYGWKYEFWNCLHRGPFFDVEIIGSQHFVKSVPLDKKVVCTAQKDVNLWTTIFFFSSKPIFYRWKVFHNSVKKSKTVCTLSLFCTIKNFDT